MMNNLKRLVLQLSHFQIHSSSLLIRFVSKRLLVIRFSLLWFRRNRLDCEVCCVLEWNEVWIMKLIGSYPFSSDHYLELFVSFRWWRTRPVPIWIYLLSVVRVDLDTIPVFLCWLSWCSSQCYGSFLYTVWTYATTFWSPVFPFSKVGRMNFWWVFSFFCRSPFWSFSILGTCAFRVFVVFHFVQSDCAMFFCIVIKG